jgi:hypothetical protein
MGFYGILMGFNMSKRLEKPKMKLFFGFLMGFNGRKTQHDYF